MFEELVITDDEIDKELDQIESLLDMYLFTSEEIDGFVLRWNATMEAWAQGITAPTIAYPIIVNQIRLDSCYDRMQEALDYAQALGYYSVSEMKYKAWFTLKDETEDRRSSICASVSIKISQKLVMTREAFEGTLTIFNGNTTTAMQEIELNLEIRNQDGELSNDLFEIETKALDILTGIDGSGSLGAEETGSATVLFIPEKGAAPSVPVSYSFGGSFSYLDPFTGVTLTKPLFPITLEVNPSPDLFLHYFMQRDILGDDALTEPIEPIVPGELAVMIENNGFGIAKNVRIESAQPEIIDNEKGLSIHFELIGSNLNGQPVQLGLTNIDFGSIAPKTSSVGQWWFTSDLLGHFVNYEAKVTHLDSRGNPDLSLISGAELHELIRSIRVYGAGDDGINDFFVNEYQDAGEVPDAIYLSQGQQIMDVYPVDIGYFEGSIHSPDFTNTLKVVNSRLGWNYIRLPDPGNGKYDLVSVSRNSDMQELPFRNAWQTYVTIPDGNEPVYENKFHMVDLLEDLGETGYTLTWKLKAPNPPAILRIEGAPTAFVSQPVSNLKVVFSKEIDPATFTFRDMMLRLQGGDDIMDTSVVITQLDSVSYNIDISSLSTGNGFYALTVQAAEVSDLEGTKGKTGKQVIWTQFLNVPVVEEFSGLPEGIGDAPFDYILVKFNLPMDISTLLPSRFIFALDGVEVDVPVTITLMNTDAQLFKISGLNALMTSDGDYTLTVDLPNLSTIDGAQGLVQQTLGWIIDTTAPSILSFTKSTDGGFDEQHVTSMDILFSEEVSGFNLAAVELWRDTLPLPLSQLRFDSLQNQVRRMSQFRLLTYESGNYTLKVNMDRVYDRAGISGSGIIEYQWSVDRYPPAKVAYLRIAPDLGYSASDGITSTRQVTVLMDIVEPNVGVELYKNDYGTLTLLASMDDVSPGELSIPVLLPSAGYIKLEVHTVDPDRNFNITKLSIVVDESAFQVDFVDVPEEPVLANPKSIGLLFTDKILASTIDISTLTLRINGIEADISGLTLVQVSDTLFTLSGLDNFDDNTGDYVLSLDLSKIEKYLSGMKGTFVSETSWSIFKVNHAPVADAGEDFIMLPGVQYTLDAALSNDPDNDQLSYEWFPPDGITLDDPFSQAPSFTAPDEADGTVFTFILSVSDGSISSADEVIGVMKNETGINDRFGETRIVVYPNPARTYFTISAGELDVSRVRMTDLSGKVMLEKNWTGGEEQSFILKPTPPGVYVISLYTRENVYMKRIILL